MKIFIPMGGTGSRITEHLAAALKEKEESDILFVLDNPEEKEEKKASAEAESDENKDE